MNLFKVPCDRKGSPQAVVSERFCLELFCPGLHIPLFFHIRVNFLPEGVILCFKNYLRFIKKR